MKRLTERDEDGFVCTGIDTNCVNGSYDILDKKWLDDALDRLAAIEDILCDGTDDYDLDRLAVMCNQRMSMREEVSKRFSLTANDPLDRLRELVEADRVGHCVVFDLHYPVVSEYYKDEDGRFIRKTSGVVSETKYKAALKAREQE